jgi:hypothetical protein
VQRARPTISVVACSRSVWTTTCIARSFGQGGRNWIYAYLFAKKDRANISPDELAEFKKLAEAYARMTALEADAAVRNRDLLEICHDH